MKSVQENFESHLTSWTREGHTRADAIVAAKSEEIDKELELRLHLHEPRMKRAEMDVHNVRASKQQNKTTKIIFLIVFLI